MTNSKQQTVVRQMYNHLLYKRDVYQKAEMYESVATLETSIELAEILLEIEKEQMIKSYVKGHDNKDFSCYDADPYSDAKQYYNETYGGDDSLKINNGGHQI